MPDLQKLSKNNTLFFRCLNRKSFKNKDAIRIREVFIMHKLQNTLYITTQGSYLHKERETLVVEQERRKVA